MSLFKGIVKLTEEQYLTLKNGGTIQTNNGTISFDENVLYVTDRDYSQMKTKIVESLPEIGEVNTIYMVLKEGSSTDYNRYMYINDRYTIIGETTIDLAGYAKLDDIPTSLPASDVYDWAKQPTKPSYSVSELPNEILTTTRSEIGGNSVTAKQSFSVVRNTNGTVNQGLMSINDNGSVRVSHRNKSVNSNADDAYIDLSSEGMIVNGEEVVVKDEVYEFGKGIYEESANLFDGVFDKVGYYINPTTGQYATASGYKASSKLYPIKTNKIYFKMATASRNMVILFFDSNGKYLNEYVSLNNLTNYVYTIQGNAHYFSCYTAEENNENIMISATDLPYQPYNAKTHITNPQAEFLKDEYTQTINLISLVDVSEIGFGGLTYKVENGVITINGTATHNFVLKFSLSSSLKLKGNYSSATFETGTKNNSWGIVLEFDDLERSADFGFTNVYYNKTSDHLYMGFDTGFSYNNYSIRPMLIEGSSSPNIFYVGKGEIAHKGYLVSNYLKYIPVKEGAGNVYTVSSSTMFNATWVNDIANGWLYVNFYSGSDNEIYGELVLNGQNVMTVSRVRYSDLGFLIPIRRGDMVRLHLNGSGYEGRDCKLYY